MSTAHTPGSWELSPSGLIHASPEQGGDEAIFVADIARDGKHDGNDLTQQERANGLLIAAAPDLLAIAEGLLGYDNLDAVLFHYDLHLLRRAVAKARGSVP